MSRTRTAEQTVAQMRRFAVSHQLSPSQRLAGQLDNVVPGLPEWSRPSVHGGPAPLPPGLYSASFDEFARRFGFNPRREDLLRRLHPVLQRLRRSGADGVLIGGSFVTNERWPGDIDALWVVRGDLAARLAVAGHRELRMAHRLANRLSPSGELYLTDALSTASRSMGTSGGGRTLTEAFQVDRHHNTVGAVYIPLDTVPARRSRRWAA